MSLTGKNKIDTNKYELAIHVDAETFAKAVDTAFHKNAKRVDVPGFRRGKAPRKIIEKMYGEGVFYDDAINEVYPAALADAIKEAELELVARPEVEAKDISKENGFDFTAVCIVKPEVKLKDYKGIEAEKVLKKVADDEVDARLASMQERNARQITVEDRAAVKGDIVNFDFDGYLDGVAFEGGKAEKFDLTLGSGNFIPGFEEQLEGKKSGEEFEVTVTFPADYHAAELAGKPAVFKCKLHEIKAKELPALDDEFAKDVSEFDTLDELKADIRAKMQEQLDHAADDAVENQIVDKVIEGMEAEIPHEMIETRIDELVQNFQYRLQSQGMDLETYIQYTGMDGNAFRKGFEEQAERQVKVRLAMETVVKLENIIPTEEDIEEEYKKAAENYQIEVQKLKEMIPADDFVSDIAVNKAIDLVRDSAKIKEVAEEAKPAAKKPAAKKPAAKKADTEETAEKKSAAKKPAAKKTAGTAEKKPAAKKSAAKKADKAE